MKRKSIFVYGVICYLIFQAVFLYTVGFVGDFLVPKSINSGSTDILWRALLVDGLLIGLFGLQHSIMARSSFKRWWIEHIPEPIERSTYVLASSLVLVLLFWQWRPLPGVVWNVETQWARWTMWGLHALGWVVVLVSVELLDSNHLSGLKQVWEHLRGEEASAPDFQTPGLYRFVRHPLMLGFLLAFWAVPQMTVGHLFFALGMTVYIFIGVHFEERALLDRFGARYEAYRTRVPMLIPGLPKRAPKERASSPSEGER